MAPGVPGQLRDRELSPVTWILLALPLLGLVILLVRPELDLQWEHHPSHFWLVLMAAAVSAGLAYLTNVVGARYRDARLVLISLAFLSSAGFLGLHALATPGALLDEANAGFVMATPVGLFIASFFAVASASPLAGPRARAVLKARSYLLGGLLVLMGAWAVASIAQLAPLDGPPPGREGVGILAIMAIVAVGLYAYAAWQTIQTFRQRGGVLLLGIAVAMVLLAEAMIAIALSRNWHLSWWEWHLLLMAAYAAIALGARTEYRRSGSLRGAFGGLYLEATLARLDRWHAGAISAMAGAEERGEPTEQVLANLRHDGASDDELAMLVQAAHEVRRLDAAFRPYLPSVVAEGIRRRGPGGPMSEGARPDGPRPGGEERVVSVVFADLTNFTTFSETRPPTEVLEMLNDYWEVVVPVIHEAGGVIEQFAGDGVMAIFNASGNQADHAERAAVTGLAIVEAARPLSAIHPNWPVFRVGANTGPAMVGNVGSTSRQSFAAIGDTTNTAARLMSAGEPGQVVIGKATWDSLGEGRRGAALGPIRVKGKREPVEAWRLEQAT